MWRKHLVKVVFPLLLAVAAGGFALPGIKKYVYIQRNLASDTGGLARNRVENLLDPWGLAENRSGEWWIACRANGMLLALTDKGSPVQDSIVTVPTRTSAPGIPGRPTGIVLNETQDFVLGTGSPAQIIAATEDGLLAAWNREISNHSALVVADNSAFAAYTGITIGQRDGKNVLFAANFRAATIDIFDGFFQQQEAGENAFSDESVPEGYAPFNVLFADGKLYVLYALQDARRTQPASGVGDRFVLIYNMDGTLLRQLAPGQGYQSAWGMALAPAGFGRYGGMLLLANSENGTIAAIDPEDGSFKGFLGTPGGWLVTVPGLRGMAYGRNSSSRLYFAAGIEQGAHGLFGYIAPGP